MSCNTFYTNFEKQPFLENKVLSKNILYKHFLRKNENNNLQTIDNNSNFSNISLKKNNTVGSSIISDEHIFEHKHNKTLKFKTFTPYLLEKNKSIGVNLYESLELLDCEAESTRLMLLLNPVKGGFRVYSHGIVGFLPKSQSVSIVKNLLKNTSKNKNAFISNILFLSKNYKQNLPLRVPFTISTVTVFPNYRKNNFVKTMSRKRRLIRNNLNFVFIYKKPRLEKPKH